MKEFNELNLIITFVWFLALLLAGSSVINAFKTSPEVVDLSLTKPPTIEEIYFTNNSDQKKRAQKIRESYDRRITGLKERINDHRNRSDLK